MNSLTNKERRKLLAEFSPAPGYILKLTRKQFEELVEDSIDVDISEEPESNSKRFQNLLKSCTDEQISTLIAALREL